MSDVVNFEEFKGENSLHYRLSQNDDNTQTLDRLTNHFGIRAKKPVAENLTPYSLRFGEYYHSFSPTNIPGLVLGYTGIILGAFTALGPLSDNLQAPTPAILALQVLGYAFIFTKSHSNNRTAKQIDDISQKLHSERLEETA